MAVMGPEIVFQLSLGEWLVANRWFKEFRRIGHTDWTMTHSFYANMGGIILHTPDQGTFPVNAAQLFHLVDEGHLPYPKISRKLITEKNKTDAVVRLLTLGQTLWFLCACIGRATAGIAVSGLEISTIAFISSAIGIFFCWYHKPMDVATTDTILMTTSVLAVHEEAGLVDDPWERTPLDFVDRQRQWPWNLYWRYVMVMAEKWDKIPGFMIHPRQKPVERFRDDHFSEPTLGAVPVLFFFHILYAAILLAGWNLELPTYTELLLWRIASLIQAGTIFFGWSTIGTQLQGVQERLRTVFHLRPPIQGPKPLKVKNDWYKRLPFATKVETRVVQARNLISEDPNWKVSMRMFVLYEFTVCVYMLARLYIVVEDMASLRAMPPSAFYTVNWPGWFPHI